MTRSKSVLAQNIQRSANAIAQINSDEATESAMDRDQAETLLRLCIICLADIASLLERDSETSRKITLSFYGQNPSRDLTLAQCREWCKEVKTLATEGVYRYRIQQALLQANAWVSDLREPDNLSEDQTLFAVETGCILLQVLQDALAAGVPENMAVELNNTPVPLAQVRQLGLYVAAAGKENEQL